MKRMLGISIFSILVVMVLVFTNMNSDDFSTPNEKMTNSHVETKTAPEMTVEELKEILSNFQQDVAPQIENDFERKLAERLYVEMKMFDESIDINKLITRTTEQADFERAWLKHAKDEYGVVVTDEEVDGWIEKGPDAEEVESQRRYAEAKEMSVYELNHEYDRDQYMKWIVWEKLIPLVTERYDEASEKVLDNNRLIELYENEVSDTL